MSIVRGSYFATWNALNIGQTELGFRKSYSYNGRNIQFDAVGSNNVDIIMSGLNMSISFVAQEYDAAAIDRLRWPWSLTPGITPPAGQSMWELAKPLILTACLVTTDPATITFPKTILAPGFDLDTNYSHIERPLPLRLMVFPVKYESEGYSVVTMPSSCEDVVYFIETYWP